MLLFHSPFEKAPTFIEKMTSRATSTRYDFRTGANVFSRGLLAAEMDERIRTETSG